MIFSAWAKTRRMPFLLLAWLLLLATSWAFSRAMLIMPSAIQPLPVSALAAMGGSLLILVPAQQPWAELTPTLQRARAERLLTLVVGVAASLSVVWAATARAGSAVPLEFGLALAAASLAWLVLIGDEAWLPAMLGALVAAYVDYSFVGNPISRSMQRVGALPLCAVLVATGVLFVFLGSGVLRQRISVLRSARHR